MTATLPDRAALFLRRAGLLAGLLAIIAGIFGMHILSGSHHMPLSGSGAVQSNHSAQTRHAEQTVAQTRQMHVEHSGHGGNARNAGPGEAPVALTALPSLNDPAPASSAFSCTGGDPCAGMSAMGASCIPSGSTGSLAAPPPSAVSFAAVIQAPPAAVSSYAYIPESPSPADLCISRT